MTESIGEKSKYSFGFDLRGKIWSGKSSVRHFQQRKIKHAQQKGGTCVSTGLSLLTGEAPEKINAQINTQDPVTWSNYLLKYGMKLAYCNTDFRRLRHYVRELLDLDDLFVVCTYTPTNPNMIGKEPDESGWVCGSHFTLMHRDVVHDTRFTDSVLIQDYRDLDRYVKRIFRVVPSDNPRGL